MKGFRSACLYVMVVSLAIGEIFASMTVCVSATEVDSYYQSFAAPEEELTTAVENTTAEEIITESGTTEETMSTEAYTTDTESDTETVSETESISESQTEESVTSPEITTPEASTTEKQTTEKQTTEKQTTTQAAWSKKNGKFYNDKNEVIPGAIKKGMDISHHQGKIDWNAVAKSDIDFVIIRCGYGDNYTSQDDKYFKYNIEMCTKYKIPYGIYLYSYAMNMTQVKSEVKHTLRLLKEVNAKPEYPIFYDMEEPNQYLLGSDTLYSFANYYCTQMIKNGYKAGVYSSYYWWTTRLTDKRYDQWYRWIARYNSFCGYTGNYIMWQSTSSGIVKGVSGKVDLNFLMYDECEAKGHSKKWTTTKAATVLKTGSQKCTCSKCGKIIKYKTIPKLKPTGHLNKKSITLRYKSKKKNKYTKLRALNLAKGDYIVKYTSTNTKIATVSKKGVIKAKKRTGKCTIKVWLASGKIMRVTVKVKK